MTNPEPLAEGEVRHVDAQEPSALVQQLRQTQRTAGALVRLIKSSDHGIPEDQRKTLLADLQMFVDAEIPTPRALYRASIAGALDTETVFILWTKARKSFMAAGPAVIDMFLAKMENEKLPYSERLLVESMKGMGFLVPSTPVDDTARAKQMQPDDIKALPDDALDDMLKAQIQRSDTDRGD
jgi:hypothetical protein